MRTDDSPDEQGTSDPAEIIARALGTRSERRTDTPASHTDESADRADAAGEDDEQRLG